MGSEPERFQIEGSWPAADVEPARILVVAPHADDEVIGCGGTIARAAAAGCHVTLVVMAMGGVKHHHLGTAASREERHAELEQAAALLGIGETRVLFPGWDMQLESLSMFQLVTALDEVIAARDYAECYLPEPSHNLDHRLTHEATLSALRQRGRRPIRLIASYEGTVAGWQSSAGPAGRLYVDIGRTLEAKIAALNAYSSQIREYPHPTSEEALRRLAAMRGLECGVEHAERFHVHRLVRI